MQKPRIPNLFIIGAPKCGTTAMSAYLAGHPNIFITEEAGWKEPDFFNKDHVIDMQTQGPQANTKDVYLNIFSKTQKTFNISQHIGEASIYICIHARLSGNQPIADQITASM
ncbi:MAG: sulfotransferase [Nitrococcus mobilis]|nr:sulfotransferase [Nitrococcus mobilis]